MRGMIFSGTNVFVLVEWCIKSTMSIKYLRDCRVFMVQITDLSKCGHPWKPENIGQLFCPGIGSLRKTSTSISSNCMRKYYVPSYNLQTEVFFRRVVTKLVTELYKLSKDKQLKSLNIFRLSCGRAPLDLILALCILHSDFSINIYCFCSLWN